MSLLIPIKPDSVLFCWCLPVINQFSFGIWEGGGVRETILEACSGLNLFLGINKFNQQKLIKSKRTFLINGMLALVKNTTTKVNSHEIAFIYKTMKMSLKEYTVTL